MATAQQNQSRLGSTQGQSKDSALLDQIVGEHSKRVVKMGGELENRIDQIEQVLPPLMKGQGARLAKRALMTFIRKGKELDSCAESDFIRAVIEAAEFGFAIDGKLAYVVPYKGKWQMQLDYKAIVAVARRTKQIVDVYAEPVFANDTFTAYREDGQDHLKHSWKMGAPRGACIGAYAVVKLETSWRYELMDIEDLNRIKNRSPAMAKGGAGPWVTDENEMRRKTIVKRILKMYCDDPATQRALELDGGEFEEDDTATSAARAQQRLNVPFNGGGLAEGEVENGGKRTNGNGNGGAKESPLAGNELMDEVQAEMGNRGYRKEQVDELLREVGAESITKATVEQARAMLKKLAEEPPY